MHPMSSSFMMVLSLKIETWISASEPLRTNSMVSPHFGNVPPSVATARQPWE